MHCVQNLDILNVKPGGMYSNHYVLKSKMTL